MSSGIAVGGLFASFGIAIFLSGRSHYRRIKNCLEWPSTSGKVLRSTTVRSEDGMWSPLVLYEYWFEDERRTSRDVSIDANLRVSFTDSFARRVVERYPEGSGVHVHFDPQNPNVAFLEYSTRWVYTKIAVGLLLAVGGVALAIVEASS